MQSRLVARSVEIILEGQAASGAYAASSTFPRYRDFCWFRDGAFVAEAMSRVGETGSAERFFDWCAGIVRRDPSGPWDSRYLLDGSIDPVAWWPHRQFDGLGLWVWAMENHLERHRVASRWGDAADATRSFLAEHWSEPCYDWWEERNGVHAATLGCIWAALRRDEIAASVRQTRERERLDGSHAFLVVLGLAGVDVLARLERELGYHRHLEDEYYAGGEWPVIAGLVGWARRANGLDAGSQLAWIEAQADPDGALPEQSGEQLRPPLYETWVARLGPPAVPLLWSHAMYLILDSLRAG
ncbi:MAG TPA: glycoside hydrolase family 15 protein [Gaiellaceae bacterium]|nr:glycoside hydrolase family 15 protein [Gaiellaceae bacterium]